MTTSATSEQQENQAVHTLPTMERTYEVEVPYEALKRRPPQVPGLNDPHGHNTRWHGYLSESQYNEIVDSTLRDFRRSLVRRTEGPEGYTIDVTVAEATEDHTNMQNQVILYFHPDLNWNEARECAESSSDMSLDSLDFLLDLYDRYYWDPELCEPEQIQELLEEYKKEGRPQAPENFYDPRWLPTRVGGMGRPRPAR